MRLLKNLPFNIRSLLLRLSLFLIAFIFITGTLGPFIIGTKLLYGWYFFIYANAGKLLLYSTIVFFLLTRKYIYKIKQFPLKKIQILFLVISAFLYEFLFWLLHQMLVYESFFRNIPLGIFAHAVLILMVAFLFLGVFGYSFFRYFILAYKKELGICLAISIVFYFGIFYIWTFWPYLSHFVLETEFLLFSLFIKGVRVFPPYTLSFPTFSISIAEACSGLDSIFLFTALYAIIWLIDRQTLNGQRMALMFIPALIGTIVVNIIRVFLLIVVGLTISPQLSATLFHTYLGMILFIIYFAIFWRILYKWLQTHV